MTTMTNPEEDFLKGIGLFGGTFNPLHNAHLKVADDVRKHFLLETIYFIPSALPPHKGTGNLADADDRFKMAAAAVSGCREFSVSDVEIRRQGLSYSIDTVRYFRNRFPHSVSCYLIVGMDAFLEIDTWKSYQSFFDLIPTIVMTRPAENNGPSSEPVDMLKRYIHAHVNPDYEFLPDQLCFIHPEKQRIYLCCVTPMNISSTKIRDRVKQRVSIAGMVPECVEHYIYEKGLYL